MKILLCCSGGFSSSMVADAVVQAGKKQGKEVTCFAVASGNVESNIGGVECVLMGPQEGYNIPNVKKVCDPLGIPVEIIPQRDYGFVDGQAVLKLAESLIKNNA